jgi:hypothetical protein
LLQFASDEFAARLLKLAGIGAEVKGGKDLWRARAATDVFAAGREELRNAIAKIVKKAAENDLVKSPITCKRWLTSGGLSHMFSLLLINATAVPHNPLHLHHAASDDNRLSHLRAVAHLVQRREALEDLAADGIAQHSGVDV